MHTRTDYIFVDFENVQKIDLDLIAGKPVVVFIVLGGGQERLTKELAIKLHKYSAQVRLIDTLQAGNNALDFVLACEVGIQSVADPEGYFHILSGDKGFDAVIKHLKEKKIRGARHQVFEKIPVLSDPAKLSPAERVKQISDRLQEPGKSRPTRKTTLLNFIDSFFHKALTEPQKEKVVKGLIAAKVISITPESKVEYRDKT